MAFPLLPVLGGLGALGGLGGLLGRKHLRGTPGRTEQFQRYTPEQQEAYSQLLSQGQQDISFDPMEQRARTQFREQTVPSLAERFTALGPGAQRSSAFQSSLGRAGAGLEEGLAGLRSQFGMQKLGMGLTPQFESAYFPREPGFGEQALTAGLPALMRILPQLIQMFGKSGGV